MPRKAPLAVLLTLLAVLLTLPIHAAQKGFDPDLLAGMRARSIGPAGMSGRVTAIEGVESSPETVYVGAASGGVWKSANDGLTWQPIFDDQPVASIGAVAVFQANPDVVWVGTGEGNTRNSASVGNGVYRSLDGGKTWVHLGLDATERIARIVLHPHNPDVAWVAALGREWGENPERGIFKTEDGGKSWKKVLYVDEKTGGAELRIDPANPQKLYAAMWQYRRWPWLFKSGGPGSGLYVTHDGGGSWKKLTEEDGLPKGDLGRIKIGVSRSNPEVVYANVEAEASALLRSEDGGKSWKTVNKAPNVHPRPFYFAALEVDPRWPNRIYSLDFEVRVSNDSGKSFETLPQGGAIHGDYHAMWIDPGDPRHLFVGDDGGVAVSRDRGQTAAFVANLPLAQFYHVAVDNEVPYNVYGGLQDNGSWRGPSTAWELGGIKSYAWTVVGDGDGFDTQPDPADASQGYAMSQSGYLVHWDLKTGEIADIRPATPDGVRLRYNWNAGLALDPFAPKTLYYGSQLLSKSTDAGKSWTVISPDLTTNNPDWQKAGASGGLTPDASGAEGYTTIIAVSASPLARGLLWVGTDDGRVQVTRDGGKSWTSVEGNIHGVPKNTWVPHIRPSRFDPASAFVVFDDHRRSNWTPYVYRTDDYGKSWESLATSELRGYALAIEQDPVDKDLLFLGTEFGLWVSQDGGGHWLRWKHGLPTAAVMDLAIQPHEEDLVIATHGRALYVLDDLRPLRTVSAATLAEPLHLYDVADALQHRLRPPAAGFGPGAGEFRGENRPYGAILTFSANLPGLSLPDPEKERDRKERERAAARQAAEEKAAGPEARAPEGGAKQAPKEEVQKEEPAKPEARKEETAEKKEPPTKAEIRIADASGKVIRTFKAPVKLGMNRAVWGLERDPDRQTPPGAGGEPDEDPHGPQVPPGVYGVSIKIGDHEVKGTVRVLPDPRSKNSDADWQARWAALTKAGELQDLAVEAVDRIARTRADVEAVAAKARQAAESERRLKGIKDEPSEPPALVKAGDKLKKGLAELEKRLWNPPDTKGLLDDATTVLTLIGNAQGGIASAWEAPSPTHLDYLRQAGDELKKFLADFNRFFAQDVAAFKKQAAEAGIELLPALPALEEKR